MKSLVLPVLLLALIPLLSLSWLSSLLKLLYPVGVAIMEDTRIPDRILDVFLRPALRIGFHGLVADLEARSTSDVNAPVQYAASLREMPIALFTADANEQHYEVETKFFDLALGARKKYSSGLWTDREDGSVVSVGEAGGALLEASEERMLSLYVERAQIRDKMTILDLGCGWGSVTLYLAERFPGARIIGVSNSKTQRKYIMEQAQARGLSNVDVKTLNIARPEFASFLEGLAGQVDRIVSIEMFEHMKNYEKLLKLLSGSLKVDGKLFVHIFCHRHFPYNFEEDDLNAWMTKHFFKGGTMPSQFLLQEFQEDLVVQQRWNVNGKNYTLTLEGWLQRMDANRESLLEAFGGAHDAGEAALQVRRWRIFMIACAEFFGFRGGSEFFVTHLLFGKRGSSSQQSA